MDGDGEALVVVAESALQFIQMDQGWGRDKIQIISGSIAGAKEVEEEGDIVGQENEMERCGGDGVAEIDGVSGEEEVLHEDAVGGATLQGIVCEYHGPLLLRPS